MLSERIYFFFWVDIFSLISAWVLVTRYWQSLTWKCLYTFMKQKIRRATESLTVYPPASKPGVLTIHPRVIRCIRCFVSHTRTMCCESIPYRTQLFRKRTACVRWPCVLVYFSYTGLQWGTLAHDVYLCIECVLGFPKELCLICIVKKYL